MFGFRIVRRSRLERLKAIAWRLWGDRVRDHRQIETLKGELARAIRQRHDVAAEKSQRIIELERKVYDLSRRLESRSFESLSRGAIVVSRPFN